MNEINEKVFLKLISYMVTSARGCIDEPKIYGSFRLLDSVSKLYYVLKDNNMIDDNKIEDIVNEIDKHKYSCITDEEEFVNSLDDILNNLIEILNEI